jgi:hypothetical protein
MRMTGESPIFLPPQDHVDDRGRLRVFDEKTLPFAPVRSFLISDVPKGQSRAGHAVSCDEIIFVIQGACLITTRDASGEKECRLTATTDGVHLPRGTWVNLSDFEPHTLVLVFASEPYADTRYFPDYVDL